MTRLPTREPEFREIEERRAFDKEQHVRKAMEAGMSREEAERHAEEDLKEYPRRDLVR